MASKSNKYLHRPFFVILILTGALLNACTEPYDAQLDDDTIRLVVDGHITTDNIHQTVKLMSTTSYFYPQAPPAVTGATLTLSDGSQVYEMEETTPGLYQTKEALKGIMGKTYSLDIQLAQPIGGETTFSASSTMGFIYPVDSIAIEYKEMGGKLKFCEIQCYVLEPPTKDFYLFLISRNRQLITDSLQEWFVSDDVLINGHYTAGMPVGYLSQEDPGQKLSKGDTVTLEIRNIPQSYANFLWQAQAEAQGSNPMFSGPPANIAGNINHGALGFFSAEAISRKSRIYSP